MKKRILSVLLAAAMVGTMLVGCGNSSSSKSSDDTKTEVVRETTNYLEEVNVPKQDDSDVTNEDIIIRSLKQPSCTRADIVNGKIEYTIQKELGIEIVGDVKVKIAYDEEEDPWEVIMDDDSNEDIQNAEEQIDQEVNEEYLD